MQQAIPSSKFSLRKFRLLAYRFVFVKHTDLLLLVLALVMITLASYYKNENSYTQKVNTIPTPSAQVTVGY